MGKKWLAEIGEKLEISEEDIKRIRRKKIILYPIIGAAFAYLFYLYGCIFGHFNPYRPTGYPFGLLGLSSSVAFSKKIDVISFSIITGLCVLFFNIGFALGFNWDIMGRSYFGLAALYGVYKK